MDDPQEEAFDDPLDFIDFADIIEHGDPNTWKFKGNKKGSPTPATSSGAAPGTMKHYDLYEDSFGDLIEVHYFRHPDGSVGDVKIKE
jgi:hypothetical protein